MTALVAAAFAATPTAALATVGTGVQAGPVRPASAIAPGSSVHLNWWVQNTGSEPSSYQLAVRPHTVDGAGALPPAWVSLPPTVDLAPGDHEIVPVTVTVPATATGGRYAAYLVATGGRRHTPGGLSVGTAAATELDADVTGGTSTSIRNAAAASAAVVLGLGGLGLRRRYRRPTT